MATVPGPARPIDVLVTGSGAPVTVFAHGLAGSIDETRPFGSGVHGSRVFFHFRGHGGTVGPATPWTYEALRQELMAVVAAYGARRALGISLGAGALLRAAWTAPDAFDRLVFVLPSAIDAPRPQPAVNRMLQMAEMVESGDTRALSAALVAHQPVPVRQRADVAVWAARRARRLIGTSVARALRDLPGQHPLAAGADLSRISCPVLVVAQQDDDAHPAALAAQLAARLPHAELRVFDGAGLVWGHRAQLRALVSSFLNAPD